MKLCLRCAARFVADDWHCPNCGRAPEIINGFHAFAPDLDADSSTGYDPRLHGELAELEAGHFWFTSRNRLILWSIEKYFGLPRTMLEIGCGTGFVLAELARRLPQTRLSGSEVHCSGLRFAKQRAPGAELYQMDARQIPFDTEFDVIGAFDVLEHIEADDAVLAEIHRSLRPAGGLILTVPQHPWLWSSADEAASHVRRYRAGELVDQVTRAGFVVRRFVSFVSLLIPLMIASRAMMRWRPAAHDLHAELRVGRTVNALCRPVMALERLLIRLGVSPPLGGSLLLIAQKES